MGETYKILINVEGKDNASGALGKVGSALGGIGTIAGGILSAGILTSLASGLINLGKSALDSYANYERLGMALQALSARELVNTGAAENMSDALAMATDKSEELQGWIQQLAIKSPFNQKDVADSFRLAMAYGFQTDMAQRLTTAMVDYSAATGASGDTMNRVALAMGQIRARGKLAGQEIMQLTEAGIPVREILAQSFGVTTAELEDMISKGLVPADEAIDALVTSMEEDFGGSAERQASTFSGLISSLQDIKEVGLREFFEGTFKAVQPYLTEFVDFLSSPETMEKIAGFGEKLGNGISNVLKFFGPAKDYVSNLFGAIGDAGVWAEGGFSTEFLEAFTAFLPDDVQSKVMGFAEGIEGIVGKVITLKDAIGQGGIFSEGEFSPDFLSAFASFFPEDLQGKVISFADNIETIISNVSTFWAEQGPGIVSGVQGVFQTIGEEVGPLAVSVVEWLSEAFGKISTWLVENGPMIQTVFGYLTTAISFIVTAITNLWPVVQTLFDGIITGAMNSGTLLLQLFTGDFAGALETVKTIFSDAFTFLQDYLASIAVWVLETFFGKTFEEGTAIVDQAMLDIQTWFQNTLEQAGLVINGIAEFFNGIKTTIDDVIDKVKEFFDSLSLGTIPDWLGSVFGWGDNARATGGSVLAGHDYLVGERGPEVFRPNISGEIIPNNELGSLRYGSSGATKVYNITVNNQNGGMSANDLAAALNQWEWAYGV